MNTAQLISRAADSASTLAIGARPGTSAGNAIPREKVDTLTHDGIEWTYRNGFNRVLQALPATLWQSPEAQGWQLVKRNSSRDVWRARLGADHYYIKYYREAGWRAALKSHLRGPACLAEWRGGIFAIEHDVPAVRPAGYARSVRCGQTSCSILVTEAVESAHPLDDYWKLLQSDTDAKRRREDVEQLIERLAELIAHAHQAGFEHLDMHPANILVQPIAARRYRTVFVDLQSARLGVPIDDHAVVRNLAQLNQWFRRNSAIADRLRFLRAYVRWRNEHEVAHAHARPLESSFRQLVQALVRCGAAHAERIGAQRDRRIARDGRYFAKLRLAGGWSGMAFAECKRGTDLSAASTRRFEKSWWKSVLQDPGEWFARVAVDVRKNSHSALVLRAVLPNPSGDLPVIVKRPAARNGWRRMRMMLPESRSWRGWRIGHALLHRDIPAARPLAVLERRAGPLVLDSLLLTEFVGGAADLDLYLRRAKQERSDAAWLRHKIDVAALLAREIRRLQERGFAHRDCKSQNILMFCEPTLRMMWIDMDGIRLARQQSQAELLRPLVRLHVSLLGVPGLTRTDRARFLKSYFARFGSRNDAWRSAWRSIAIATEEKLRTSVKRREWKHKHYGRD